MNRNLVVASMLLLAGCGGATPAPKELLDARSAFAKAKEGHAKTLAPADLHEAETALGRAEAAFRDDAVSSHTRDLSTIAKLKALLAESQGNILEATRRKELAQKELGLTQSERLTAAEGSLNRTREQLEKEKQALEAERQKRLELEGKLKDAMATLAKIAQVKDEDRGLVITLQGEVLFKTGESTLKPAAMIKLDQIAETLRGQERKIVVIGHTDNQGGAGKYNQELSEKRAAAVREYLVSKGIPSDLVRSEGKGPSQPVAENTSIEGRATNRRVEIVVEPKK